ncbi:hypothetical protein N2603_36595 [Bradyrhizobium huanghuaihaiense]|uniref:hypothetical protein n=1 Tax=Bradyrhizobium huanghuaihaiense TaxID=990078 RepID=UPI0021AA8C07|nr:hypothetical protein [Bradyrhizobium sp. CB3035]UWU75488.1 hypothetical protein N2603_36595 [Bradyrhizobium sp. CB3035]
MIVLSVTIKEVNEGFQQFWQAWAAILPVVFGHLIGLLGAAPEREGVGPSLGPWIEWIENAESPQNERKRCERVVVGEDWTWGIGELGRKSIGI